MEILEWINMCHGACPLKIKAWMLYGPSMKIFASHRPMKLEPDLTCWQVSDKETDLSMSGTMQFELKCLNKYPPETVSILHRYMFWFFLKHDEFVSKTINGSNIDLDKFPASKVRQLAKKIEFSKSNARYTKAVVNDPQGDHVNLMRHQRTDLPFHKASPSEKQHSHKSKSKMRYWSEHKNQRTPFKKFDPSHTHKR